MRFGGGGGMDIEDERDREKRVAGNFPERVMERN